MLECIYSCCVDVYYNIVYCLWKRCDICDYRCRSIKDLSCHIKECHPEIFSMKKGIFIGEDSKYKIIY